MIFQLVVRGMVQNGIAFFSLLGMGYEQENGS
jgi:hypothetical protein